MKSTKSKLDQFAGPLADMEAEKKTLEEMREWLKGEGCTVSSSTLSVFLREQRSARQQSQVLGMITTGARQCKEVQTEFEKHPAPELETLIKLVKVLIMQLSTGSVDNPDNLVLADRLTNTVLQFVSGQTKAAFKEREVTLAEQKQSDAKKSDQQKALELCLEEANAFPEVQKLFREAFAALKKAKGK